MRRHDGRYYCIYSGGSWLSESYHVAWASAPHPLGPWTEPPAVARRLLATVPGHVRGPGHNSIVTTPAGTDMLVYHAWNADGTPAADVHRPAASGTPTGRPPPAPAGPSSPFPTSPH